LLRLRLRLAVLLPQRRLLLLLLRLLNVQPLPSNRQ
jgi:hypothetical protein